MNTIYRKIADYLLLNSPYVQDVGLFHGKMGIVVALYSYAFEFEDQLLEEFSWDLLQQVYDGLHSELPLGIEFGLSGIAYGVTLLCKKGWIECDLNDILADIDSKIMEYDPKRITDYSLRIGLRGLLLYISARKAMGIPLRTFDYQYLSDFQVALSRSSFLNVDVNLIDVLNKRKRPKVRDASS
jgi:hypothetical protein